MIRSLDDLARDAPRRVRVQFARPVPVLTLPGTVIRAAKPDEWEAEVVGPLGAFLRAIEALPVHDLHVDAFNLERHLLEHYAHPQPERVACA